MSQISTPIRSTYFVLAAPPGTLAASRMPLVLPCRTRIARHEPSLLKNFLRSCHVRAVGTGLETTAGTDKSGHPDND